MMSLFSIFAIKIYLNIIRYELYLKTTTSDNKNNIYLDKHFTPLGTQYFFII